MRLKLVTHSFALVRSPLLPIDSSLNQLPLTEEETDQVLWNWLNQLAVEQALQIASPTLHKVWLRWQKQPAVLPGQDARLALWRYILRMSSRSTPFGMFAGVSVATVGRETIGTMCKDIPKLCIRPDAAWLSALVDQLVEQPQIRLALRYKVNNSLYRLGTQLRYSDYTLQAGQRAFYINSVECDDTIEAVLSFVGACAEGAQGRNIVAFLIDTISEEPEAAQVLVDELINSHILISELEPSITGDGAFGQLLQRLTNIPAAQSLTSEIRLIQEQLQRGTVTTLVAHHTEERMRKQVGEVYTEKGVCQIDLFRPTEEVMLNQSVVEQLGQELLQLSSLRNDSQSPALSSFAQRLNDRYGSQAVPLLQSLDHETGIGYGDSGPPAGQLSLLNSLNDQAIPVTRKADRLDGLRLDKLTAFLETGQFIQPITDEDLNKTAQSVPDKPLARSWAVLGELYGADETAIDAGHYQFLLKSVSGPSAASLMARFGSHHQTLAHRLRQLTDWEAQQYPNDILAEIAHLPAGRVGNVLSRPAVRMYEIPYVTPSSVDDTYTIALEDLWVRTIDGTTVELWSKRYNQRVMPRNTTAHNYHQSDDVYRFLTDLSHQDEGFSMRWSWGMLDGQPRLPRIVYKHLILARAQWSVTLRGHWLSATVMADDLRQCLSLPRLIALVEGDHELLLDLSSPPCQQILFTELSKRDSVRVAEWLGSPAQCWLSRAGQRYSSELVIPFGLPQAPPPPRHSPFRVDTTQIQRSFGPGSEWLYVKVYVGELTANDVLRQVVGPMVTKAMAEQWIDHWFFIRYYDPEHHLRLRFHGSESTYHLILTELTRQLAPWQEMGLVHSTVVDTYQRELERYGHLTIPLAERLFWRDSEWNLLWINQSAALDEDMHWWVACERADQLLDAFGLSASQKQELIVQLQVRFLSENKQNHMLRKELNTQYRAWQERVAGCSLPDIQSVEDWRPLVEQIQRIRRQDDAQTPDFTEFVRSILHMLFNRFFVSNQRMSEGVVYHFLVRRYATELTRKFSSTTQVY